MPRYRLFIDHHDIAHEVHPPKENGAWSKTGCGINVRYDHVCKYDDRVANCLGCLASKP